MSFVVVVVLVGAVAGGAVVLLLPFHGGNEAHIHVDYSWLRLLHFELFRPLLQSVLLHDSQEMP